MNLTRIFKGFALAEAISWCLLLIGMVLKHVTHTTDLGVQIGGSLHGAMFLGYVLSALKLWQERSWAGKTIAIALLCAVIPFATIWFERRAEARGDI